MLCMRPAAYRGLLPRITVAEAENTPPFPYTNACLGNLTPLPLLLPLFNVRAVSCRSPAVPMSCDTASHTLNRAGASHGAVPVYMEICTKVDMERKRRFVKMKDCRRITYNNHLQRQVNQSVINQSCSD